MNFKTTLLSALLVFGGTCANAQLSKNPNKFLGNITTAYQVRSDYDKYWNQLTPENETKWASVEGTRDQFNWGAVDAEYNYCKEHGFAFKFHTLVWGGQYPSWMNGLSQKEQLEEITEWFDAVAGRYPDLEYIDVVNEALSGHNPAPFKNALGGDGKSGYDWIVTAFNMARERWPKAVLIYNDFNTFQYDTDRYIDLIQKIKAAGAPVDAAGCQSHDLDDMSGADFKKVLEKVHDGTGLPIFISEYDICKADDQIQLQRYKEQFPIMWEADYVAGVTLWGYIYGQTWVDDGAEKGASGLIKNGVERPALKWLREYMQTDTAINAKSPLIESKGFAFVSASSNTTLIGKEVTIKGKATNDTLPIDTLELFLNKKRVACIDGENIEYKWTPIEPGSYEFTMKAYCVSSTVYEKSCFVSAFEPGKPFKGQPIALPGVLEAEDFDEGANDITYADNDQENQGGKYRETGVDIDASSDGGYVLGWTNSGEWLEYTVNVAKKQTYIWSALVSSGVSNSGFQMYFDDVDMTGRIEVPQTGNNSWDTYVEVKGRTNFDLPEGEHKLRIVITGSSCNIDKITFSESNGNEDLTTPYSGKPIVLPGTIQAENFNVGMEGCAYHDNDPSNQGDKYRSTGVDIVEGNGGYAIGYTAAGEWTVYTVTVKDSQKLYWCAVVSSGVSGGGSFKIVFDESGDDVTGEIKVPKTKDWDTYTKVAGETLTELPAGTYKLRLIMDKANCNVDKIMFSVDPISGISSNMLSTLDGTFDVFSIMGVFKGTAEIVNGDTSVLSGLFEQGVYILRNRETGETSRIAVY